MLKTLLMTTALVAAATAAQAAAEITCGAPVVYVGQQSRDASDTVIGVDVYHSTDDRQWHVRHRMANGSEIYRINQYLMRDTTKGNLIQWQGASFKYPGLVMVGEILRDQRNQLVYVESIYNNGALKMKSGAYCKQVQVAYSPPPQYTPPPPPPPPPSPPVAVPAPQQQPTIIVVPMPPPIQLPPVTVNPEPKQEPKAEPKPEPKAEPVAKRNVIPINVQNNAATLNVGIGSWTVTMLLDTGANFSSVTESLADDLVRGGYARWTGEERYRMADGSVAKAMTILIREVKIGIHVVRDVKANVLPNHADNLLGFAVLAAIGSFTIDMHNGELSFVMPEAALVKK